ncbi:major outer membrane protein FomA [Fusobacterium varium]|uniref:major outer membrane protein FomA n=1 Tax=Fusobacterium varium TaxID=856 RepID=UPI000E5498C8|nr:hypothetical protein [Fusobacterium varium]MCD7980669.1 hypothetical protein [Fusobacterium sp.]MCF0170697.1 hypothetical protein [Fusobacterium varium]RHG34147.1 hypothetical protein DW261_10830 [Fusobacterium varium]
MKKSLLLVGAFLTVAAMAQAKEVVPAPVVVEEAPVQVVEKEVIVYRDKEEGFRPNGYVNLHYKYYGDAEELNYKNDGKNNNYGRVELKGKINMTENQALEYRIRDYNSWNSTGNTEDKGIDGTEARFRYFYNHGNLGDSKVNLTSRIHYQDNGHDDDSQELQYQARFNFADYMFNNDFVKTTDFVVAPKYGYTWAANNDDYDNQIGVDLYTMHEFPLGFSFEFNVYATQHFYGKDKETGANSKTDDNFGVDVEAYLYNTTNLYSNGKLNVDFYFEGGFDPYSWNSENVLKREYRTNNFDKESDPVKVSYEDSKYRLYAWPQIITSYNVTDSFKTYVSLGAEYTNGYKYESDAQDWRWQPVAVVGFTTTF